VRPDRVHATATHLGAAPPSRYCDAFTEKDNLYIVMEFAEGGDIGRQVEKFRKANKYVKEDHIWSYTIQMCRALNELHSRSILHRVRPCPSLCLPHALPSCAATAVLVCAHACSFESPLLSPPLHRRTSSPRTCS